MPPIRHHPTLLFLLLTLLVTSCYSPAEATPAGGGEEETPDGQIRVTFTITQIEQIPFDTSAASSIGESTPDTRATLTDLCTRLSIALFRDGTRLKTIHQSSTEAGTDFGTITLTLDPAEYQIVAIAHNGLGHCTISTPEKVTFASNKLTDTFYYYGTLDLTTTSATRSTELGTARPLELSLDHPQEPYLASNTTRALQEPYITPLVLTRPVSMFRLILTDTIPSDVARMQFYYTGGSSTFSPLTGFGCVNSRQTETFSLSPLTPHPSTFEVYTFPHEPLDFLNITITALDAAGLTLHEKTLGNILVQPNVITQHTEAFFPVDTPDPSDPSDPEPSDPQETTVQPLFSIYNDGQWDSIVNQ